MITHDLRHTLMSEAPMLKRVLCCVTLLLGMTAPVWAQSPTPQVEYYHLDVVGSVRAVTNQSGQVVRRHDYLPFGEGDGVAPGTSPQRFTAKERDGETGLDYFGARYYASRSGRFTTVDPVYTWRDNLTDPQLWNRYAYARNNPLRFTDPDGRCVYPGADCVQYLTGAAKSVFNAVLVTPANVVNTVVNVLFLSPFTDYRFHAEDLTPTNEDQRRGMFGADVAMLLSPLATEGSVATVDKWSRVPKSLMDEMVMGAAKEGKGIRIIDSLGDKRFKGMEKWSYGETSKGGLRSEVHYVRDPKTGELMDFKFAQHAETYK